MPSIVDWVFKNAELTLFKDGVKNFSAEMLDEIEGICRGLSHNLLGTNRLQSTPEYISAHDFESWLQDVNFGQLSEFERPAPVTVRYVFSEEQYKIVEDTLDRNGRTSSGLSRALLRIPVNDLWRQPEIGEKHEIA